MEKAQKGALKEIKKCPECFSNLSMDTKVCPWCNQRVKTAVNKHGYAKKPVNWYAYLICFLSWLGLILYIWWAFFK